MNAQPVLQSFEMPAPLDANRVAPRLWQGSDPPQGTYLREVGVDVLVLCAREHQLPAEVYPGVKVIHAPMDDTAHVPVREAMAAATAAAREHRKGKRVLVCCHMGLNRSGIVSALIIWMRSGRMAGWQAVQQVQRHREDALGNQWFSGFVAGLPPHRLVRSAA